MGSERDRYLMALYYAFGRNDGDKAVYVPPAEFADHYRGLYAAVESGASSFCPAVQYAWSDYVKRLAAS